jgi:uncharacterized protein
MLLLRISVWILDFFHLQVKMGLKKIFPDYNFDLAMIDARNKFNKKKFEVSEKRIFLAPHCMRSPDCPAASSQYGIQCIRCGSCKYDRITKEAEKLDYSIFILAGSSFIKKLIEENKPESVLLLGCSYEINKVMMAFEGRVTYGITLLKDGCVNTDADMDKIFTIMHLGKKTELSEKMNHVNRRS